MKEKSKAFLCVSFIFRLMGLVWKKENFVLRRTTKPKEKKTKKKKKKELHKNKTSRNVVEENSPDQRRNNESGAGHLHKLVMLKQGSEQVPCYPQLRSPPPAPQWQPTGHLLGRLLAQVPQQQRLSFAFLPSVLSARSCFEGRRTKQRPPKMKFRPKIAHRFHWLANFECVQPFIDAMTALCDRSTFNLIGWTRCEGRRNIFFLFEKLALD